MRDREKIVPEVGTGDDNETSRFSRLKRNISLCARAALAATCMQAGGMAGIAATNQMAPAKITAGPFEGKITVDPLMRSGGTTVKTSVGDLKYSKTHKGAAIDIAAQVKDSVEPEQVFNSTASTMPDELGKTEHQLKENIPIAARDTVIRTSGGYVLGGLVGGTSYLGLMSSFESLIGRERQKTNRKIGALCVTAVLSAGLVPFTAQPFATRNGDYTQSMQATGLLAHGQQYADNYDTYTKQLDNPSKEFFALNSIIEHTANKPEKQLEPDVCLVIVSDPHGGGYRPGNELALKDHKKDCQKITLVNGDLTDWGQNFELQRPAIQVLPDLTGKKLVIKGNHDSTETMQDISKLPGVSVLDSQVYSIYGLSILGISDPTFTPDNPDHEPTAPDNYELGAKLAKRFDGSNMPDIVMTHEPAALEGFLNSLPKDAKLPVLVTAGHTHKLKVSSRFANRDVVYVNPGSVSGGGLRLINPQTDQQTPLSAVSVYLSNTEDGWQVNKTTSLSEDYQGQNSSLSVRTFDSK